MFPGNESKNFNPLNSHFLIFHTEAVHISTAWDIVCDSRADPAKVREDENEVPTFSCTFVIHSEILEHPLQVLPYYNILFYFFLFTTITICFSSRLWLFWGWRGGSLPQRNRSSAQNSLTSVPKKEQYPFGFCWKSYYKAFCEITRNIEIIKRRLLFQAI